MTPSKSLLLVPPLATVSCLAQHRETFQEAIAACISNSQPAQLFVALPLDARASKSWHVLQSLLAHAYALASAACVKLDVPCEGDGGAGSVATTVVLLWDDLDAATSQDGTQPGSVAITAASALVTKPGQWKSVMHAQGPSAFVTRCVQLLARSQTTPPRQITLSPAPALEPQSEADADDPNSPRAALFRTVCLGGTFDHLHLGHKLLLHAAMLLLDKRKSSTLIVGITGDALLKDKQFAAYIQPWEDRARAVLSFVSAVLGEGYMGTCRCTRDTRQLHGTCAGGSPRVHCVEIHNAFGPTVTQEDMDALVVSGETRGGGEAVNDKRRELGWKDLVTFAVDVLHDTGLVGSQDGWEGKLSSTAIRKQRFERAGAEEPPWVESTNTYGSSTCESSTCESNPYS